MKNSTYFLVNTGWFLLIASCLLTGCISTKTTKYQTGVIHHINGGIITVNSTNSDFGIVKLSQAKKAFIVLDTSLGNFSFTSDDTRKPEEIVRDFSFLANGLTNQVAGENGSVTISIVHEAYRSWKVYQTQQRISFNFPSQQLSSSSSGFWIRDFLQPPSDYTPTFEKAVNVPFILQETTRRSLDKAATGP